MLIYCVRAEVVVSNCGSIHKTWFSDKETCLRYRIEWLSSHWL